MRSDKFDSEFFALGALLFAAKTIDLLTIGFSLSGGAIEVGPAGSVPLGLLISVITIEGIMFFYLFDRFSAEFLAFCACAFWGLFSMINLMGGL